MFLFGNPISRSAFLEAFNGIKKTVSSGVDIECTYPGTEGYMTVQSYQVPKFGFYKVKFNNPDYPDPGYYFAAPMGMQFARNFVEITEPTGVDNKWTFAVTILLNKNALDRENAIAVVTMPIQVSDLATLTFQDLIDDYGCSNTILAGFGVEATDLVTDYLMPASLQIEYSDDGSLPAFNTNPTESPVWKVIPFLMYGDNSGAYYMYPNTMTEDAQVDVPMSRIWGQNGSELQSPVADEDFDSTVPDYWDANFILYYGTYTSFSDYYTNVADDEPEPPTPPSDLEERVAVLEQAVPDLGSDILLLTERVAALEAIRTREALDKPGNSFVTT